MREPRAAASVLFNLEDYRVVDAVEVPGAQRQVLVEGVWQEAACPACGVLSGRVHQRVRQRLRDVPIAGRVQVTLLERRFACMEPACGRRTFVGVSDQVPLRARVTTRLRAAALDAVVTSGRVVAEVAAAHAVSWWTVAKAVNAAADLLTDPDDVAVTRLGIDEHRYRAVRFYRDRAGSWARYEPGGTSRSRGSMTTFVDATTGRVLGVADGRDSTGVGAWLAVRSPAWRGAVQVLAIDPSAAFRRALREQLPRAAVSVDAFHLVKLANDALTQVRQRVTREGKGRRGRSVDPAWVNRRLLMRAVETLSPRALARLQATPRADDPTHEVGAAWGVEEQLRRLLASTYLADATHQRMVLGVYVLGADTPETDRLWNTINAWWPRSRS